MAIVKCKNIKYMKLFFQQYNCITNYEMAQIERSQLGRVSDAIRQYIIKERKKKKNKDICLPDASQTC